MKVYKVEIMVLDFDNVGEDGTISLIENTRYPNHAIAPSVMAIDSREIEWSDEHPLNCRGTMKAAFATLFDEEVQDES